MRNREKLPATEQDPTKFQPKRRDREEDDSLDEAIEETFPASDPPSVTRPDERDAGAGRDRSV